MTDAVVSAIERASIAWHKEAEERRRISKTDPIADTLDYCAGEIAARLRDATSARTLLTVEAYAKQEGVTPQTVRTWIRHEQLTAVRTAKGYRVHADAVRVRRVG